LTARSRATEEHHLVTDRPEPKHRGSGHRIDIRPRRNEVGNRVGHLHGMMGGTIDLGLPGAFSAQGQDTTTNHVREAVGRFDHATDTFVSCDGRQRNPMGIGPRDWYEIGGVDRHM
ncbi:hypothetical protein LZ189_24255, partial [Rhodovulum sulfidophilum]|nr:hypothetical protein [Rhodovulum sulfidophilum]